MKARIVERTRQNGTIRYVIQQKFLFWWFDGHDDYESLAEAKKKFCFYDGTKIKDRIVNTENTRKSCPETKIIIDKLHDIFKSKLSDPKCPADYIESLSPHVKEEFKEDIMDAVNESAGKVYVVRHPSHGRKILMIDSDFAQKILALGGLP